MKIKIWHGAQEAAEESDSGICRIPDKERAVTARLMWRQTNLLLEPATLMSHSVATRWGWPSWHPVNTLLFLPPLFFADTLSPPQQGFPHTHECWHRYVVERRAKEKVETHSAGQTKAWHRYKLGDQQLKWDCLRWLLLWQYAINPLAVVCSAALWPTFCREMDPGYSTCVPWPMTEQNSFSDYSKMCT